MRAGAQTANDRFKRGFSDWFWGSMVAATLFHFAFLAFWPAMNTADASFTPDVMTAVEIPPEIEIPPPPEQISRPAVPVVSSAQIDEDITIAQTTFEANPPPTLPTPPGRGGSGDIGDSPRYVPHTVSPVLRNRAEVARSLERNYPALLRDAGIGGTPTVWFLIAEDGRVVRTQLHESSGYEALDRAAMNVAQVMEFSPALNRDQRVQVWVSLGIVFQAR
jgi:periplasmic protein TonB